MQVFSGVEYSGISLPLIDIQVYYILLSNYTFLNVIIDTDTIQWIIFIIHGSPLPLVYIQSKHSGVLSNVTRVSIALLQCVMNGQLYDKHTCIKTVDDKKLDHLST